MSIAKQAEYATASDLAALASGELDVDLKTLPGKKIKIKKLSIGEIADIMKVAKDNDLEQAIWMTFRGIVQPKISVEEVRKWPPSVLMEIAIAVGKYSGMDRKSMEQTTNLLGIES